MSGPCTDAGVVIRNVLVPGGSPGQVPVIGPDGSAQIANFAPARIPVFRATIALGDFALTSAQPGSGNPDNVDVVLWDSVAVDTFSGYNSGTGEYTPPSSLPGLYLVAGNIQLDGFFVDDETVSYGQVLAMVARGGTPVGDAYGAWRYPGLTANAGDGQLAGSITWVDALQVDSTEPITIVVSSRGLQTGNPGSINVTFGSTVVIHYLGKI